MDASGINRCLRGYPAKTLKISAARYLRYITSGQHEYFESTL